MHTLMEIYALLPKENCGKCDLPSCMAFAVRMLNKEKYLSDCPILEQAKYIQQRMALKEIASDILKAEETKLVIHEEVCNGCGNCVIACPPDVSVSLEASGGKGPRTGEVVIKMKDGKVIPCNLKLCRRFEGDVETRPCSICIESCPFGAIEFV